MQLVHQNTTDKKSITQQLVNVPQAEFDKECIRDYEAMILANPSKPATSENSTSPALNQNNKKVAKISVADLREPPTVKEHNISRTETQVGVVGVS